MIFGTFFSKLGHAFGGEQAQHAAAAAGVAAVKVYAPGLGALVESVGNAIVAVEARSAAGGQPASGPEKKEQVKEIIDVAAPVAVSVLTTATGKTIPDPAALAPAIDKLIDDIVALFNALGVFAKSAA